jgi:sRNA-binding carbon storage regulator CsrA
MNTTINKESPSQITIHRLELLTEVYRHNQASALMERTLEKLFQYEAESSRQQLNQLEQDIAEYEEQYGLSSDEFFRRYQEGQTDDRMDYVEWASLFQMTQRLKIRLALLTGENGG